MRMNNHVAIATSFLCVAIGCSSSSDATNAADAGAATDASVLDGQTGDPSVLVGTFLVQLVQGTGGAPGVGGASQSGGAGGGGAGGGGAGGAPAAGGASASASYTSVFGKVYDGPTPTSIVWEQAGKEGDCQLVTPRVPFCATPCGGSAVCVEDDTCQKYPTSRSVGTVVVKGLVDVNGATEFSMDPLSSAYQAPASVSLPYPAFQPGDVIHFSATGGTFTNPFVLEAKGIAPLLLTSTDFSLAPGSPIAVAWQPASDPSLSSIHVKLDISHHGGSKGKIECDTSDTGSLAISAPLISQLLALGVAGFPTIIITRSAVGSSTISAGRVDLIVSSTVEVSVTVPGVISCTSDQECGDGKTCQTDLTCK